MLMRMAAACGCGAARGCCALLLYMPGPHLAPLYTA